MGEVGQCAAVRFTARFECRGRDEERRDDRRPHQHDRHDEGGSGQQLLGVADPTRRLSGGVGGVTLDQGHDHHTGFETGQAEGQGREDQQGRTKHAKRRGMGVGDGSGPVTERAGGLGDMPETVRHDHGAEADVGNDEGDGDPDGLAKPFEEDRCQQHEKDESEPDLLPVERLGEERVLHEVG